MEQVLVVERSAFFAGDWPQGFVDRRSSAESARPTELEARAFFADRARAEREPAWKQLIPYCAIRRGPDVFCVERLRQQGEARLHGLLSVGIGGHVNPIDDEKRPGILLRSLLRELHEELILPPGGLPPPRWVGLLNDDSNPVGRVHAGLVFLLELRAGDPAETVGIREISKMRGGFRSLAGLAELWQDPARFETWSSLLLGSLLLPMETRAAGQRAEGQCSEDGREKPQSG